MDGLKERLESHAKFLDEFLGLIPAKFYIPQTDESEISVNSKFAKNLKGKAPKQAIKEASKRAKKESKRKNLLPDAYKSVPEIQKETVEKEQAEPKKQEKKPKQTDLTISQKPSLSLEELKERLHKKIEDLRTKRKVDPNFAENQKENKKRKKTSIDQRVVKKDRKSKDDRQKKSSAAVSASAADAQNGKKRSTDEQGEQKQKQRKKEKELEEKLQYGTFTFTDGKPVPTYLALKPKKPLKEVIKKVSEEKKRMAELAGTDAGKKLKEAKQWNTALAKAKGEKVKDDLKKLKQTAKRRSHQKKKSATEWKDRNEAVKQSQAERQEERRRNIAERMRKIKDKKSGGKKPKARPGFEGKKKGYLNK